MTGLFQDAPDRERLGEATKNLVGLCNFPPPGTQITLAVSGGPDSSALLVLAVACGCVPHVIYVDHHQRNSSGADGEFVGALAEAFGASFECRSVEVSPGPNLEARLREARLLVLPGGTATGHTKDDLAETVLINLLRGAGTGGLAAMSKSRNGTWGERSRNYPILGLRRAHTGRLCESLGISTVNDPMNLDRRFLRNRVRSELIPLMNDLANRDVVEVLYRQSVVFADDHDLLESLAGALDPTDARELTRSPAPLARRALRNWIQASDPEGYVEDFESIERVLQVASNSRLGCNLKSNRTVRRSKGRLTIEPAGPHVNSSTGT